MSGPVDDSDYFSNHARARRFPWSLYHAPLERDLAKFLTTVAQEHPQGHVLVVGCGLLHEIDAAPAGLTYSVADIDARAVDAVMSRHDSRIVAGHVVPPEVPLDEGLASARNRPSGGKRGKFAAIYAKEVVEHVIAWPMWLVGLRRSLLPNGRLWLSTPNYGEPWLPAVESTALELIARRDGFSRRDIHPTRFSTASLHRGLVGAGFDDVRTNVVMPRFAITAWAKVS
jgi:2-polyprenyl-3-methyl-5-hydroxy-6-metoxy-1,4-benzoquinol methylase